MEVFQAGAELVGVASAEGDAEMIVMGIESLIRIGYDRENITVALSNVAYIHSAIAELKLDESCAAAVEAALIRKDGRELTAVLDKAGTTGPARDALESAPGLFGDISKLNEAPLFNDEATKAINDLKQVVDVLTHYGVADRVVIDLAEVRGFAYYTGITFEGFIDGLPKRAFSGGRYDNLLAAYGSDVTATGFAVDIDHLLDSSSMTDWTSADALVLGEKDHAIDAVKAAKKLRSFGLRIARDLGPHDIDGAKQRAEKLKIPVIVITNNGLESADETVRVINVNNGEDQVITVAQLISIIEPVE
jgi:ATP phosphoribosyltransferase regulatory subunit